MDAVEEAAVVVVDSEEADAAKHARTVARQKMLHSLARIRPSTVLRTGGQTTFPANAHARHPVTTTRPRGKFAWADRTLFASLVSDGGRRYYSLKKKENKHIIYKKF